MSCLKWIKTFRDIWLQTRQKLEETKRRKWEAKQQLEEAAINDRHERERKLWEQKLQAELEITEKRMELEREAKSTNANNPFQGNCCGLDSV